MSKRQMAAHSVPATSSFEPRLQLLDLPSELLDEIFGHLSYDEIAQLRVVSQTFNGRCSQLLNRGFNRAERYHGQCLKKVKAQLPRRESERRSHPLSRHCEILSAIETRLSLLSMTYIRYIEANLCCFIPGKVIDEIFRVLRFVQNNPNPPRIAELLQELRDISSMAMEFFEERIVPNLKTKINSTSTAILCSRGSSIGGYSGYRPLLSLQTPSTSCSGYSTPTSSKEYRENESFKLNQTYKRELSAMKTTMKSKFKEMERRIREQADELKQNAQSMKDMQGTIQELLEWRKTANTAASTSDKRLPSTLAATVAKIDGDHQVAGPSKKKTAEKRKATAMSPVKLDEEKQDDEAPLNLIKVKRQVKKAVSPVKKLRPAKQVLKEESPKKNRNPPVATAPKAREGLRSSARQTDKQNEK